jgi:hypothetical protein
LSSVAGRFLVLTAVQGLGASNAHAQVSESNSATAQALFDEARKLMAQGKLAEACPKLQESQRLDPGTGTLLNLATCYERQGKLATAWSKYLEAAASALAAHRADRARFAREQAAKLAPKVSKLVINVAAGDATPGLEVKRDGTVVGQPQWGVSVPVDPGEHRVSASAPNRKPWETSAMIKTGGPLLTIDVPELVASSSAASPQARAVVAVGASHRAGTPPPSTDVSEESSGLGTQRVLALVAGGVGIAAFGVDGVFFFRSKAKRDEAAGHCNGDNRCDPTGLDLRDQAIAAGNVATISSIVGAIGIVGGAALWITAPSSGKSGSTPRVGVSPSGISIRGEW